MVVIFCKKKLGRSSRPVLKIMLQKTDLKLEICSSCKNFNCENFRKHKSFFIAKNPRRGSRLAIHFEGVKSNFDPWCVQVFSLQLAKQIFANWRGKNCIPLGTKTFNTNKIARQEYPKQETASNTGAILIRYICKKTFCILFSEGGIFVKIPGLCQHLGAHL